jgi:hypothetical protein
MSGLTRRELLRRLAGGVASGCTLLLARAVPAADGASPAAVPAAPDERADALAREAPPGDETYTASRSRGGAFRNAGFRNGGGGGFRNGAFRNGGGGGFRNGGFANGGGGGAFRNGAFRNF